MNENDFKKHIAVYKIRFMGNISSNSYIGYFSNYITLKSKNILMIIGSIKEDLTRKKSFSNPRNSKT